MGSDFPLECKNIYKDSLRTIDWTKTSDVASKIDYSKAGLMGHSMGGGSSYHAASDASVVEEYNIGAVVGLHPQVTLFDQQHTPYVIAMFDCHLKGDKGQCDKVYGSGSESLCNGPVAMTECVRENAPSAQVTV